MIEGSDGEAFHDGGIAEQGHASAGHRADAEWERNLELANRLDRLLRAVEERVEQADFRVSISDYIRLLQLRKELREAQPTEITVKWVEPSEADPATAR